MVKDDKKIIEALKAIEEGECRSGKWKNGWNMASRPARVAEATMIPPSPNL